MIRVALAALLGLVVVLVASLMVASVVGLGPEEFWILPVIVGTGFVVGCRLYANRR